MPEPTRAEQREAARQHRKKLALESELFRRMKRFFKRQTRQIFDKYELENILMDAAAFNPELAAILEKHYWKAANWYGPRVLNEINSVIGAKGSDKLTTDNAIIAGALATYIRQSVDSNVEYLSRKTNELNERAIDKTSTKQEARKYANGKATMRADRHATNINQQAIEGSKQQIASNAHSAVTFTTGIVAIFRQVKTWVAIIDKAVRAWHAAAHGQTVPVSDPFIVDNQEMMFPGDHTRGATAKNIERCRCVSVNSTKVA